MQATELLRQGFDQVRAVVGAATDGLDVGALARRPGGANPIGWLVWHLARVQDDHVAEVAGREQVWTAQGWQQRFDLPLPAGDTGYGHSAEQVAAVRADAGLLTGYLDAVLAVTVDVLDGLAEDDLDRVVDTSYDPPVTLGVRLASVLADDLQHAGQAAYARGMLAG